IPHRRCRQRARDGMILIPVMVNLERVRDILLGAELLAEWDYDDRQAINRCISACGRTVDGERRTKARKRLATRSVRRRAEPTSFISLRVPGTSISSLVCH